MADAVTPLWIEPTQDRSREKVDRMLDAALDLAVEANSLDIKVTEVAKRANVAIGSLYQFFPTRRALIAKLFAREMQPIDARVGVALADLDSFEALGTRIETELRASLDIVRSRPGLSLIWASKSVDPAIEAADFANTQKNASQLAAQIAAYLGPAASRGRVHATALLICHLWGSIVRLCLLAPDSEQDALLHEYTQMLVAHSQALAVAT